MRRDLATQGMNWKQRQAYRLKRRLEIANEKATKEDTVNRLMEMVIAIEDAFKPEADALHAKIVASWIKAHAFVMANGKTLNEVRTAKTGFDCDANKLPQEPYPKYTNSRADYTEAWKVWYKLAQPHRESIEGFNNTIERDIIGNNLYDDARLLARAHSTATEIVLSNKAKLLNGVARYMRQYKTAIVDRCEVKCGVKGFQGNFYLTTDQGPRLFTCKAITASGPIVSFHWRYIIHVKS